MAIIPGQQAGSGASFASPQEEKQKKLLYIFGFLALAAGAIIYFGFYYQSAPSEQASFVPATGLAPEQITENLIKSLQGVNFEAALLSDKKFKELVLPGNLPISVGEKGRDNPFAPF